MFCVLCHLFLVLKVHLLLGEIMSIEQAIYEITHMASYQERLQAIEAIIQSLKMPHQWNNRKQKLLKFMPLQ